MLILLILKEVCLENDKADVQFEECGVKKVLLSCLTPV